MSKKAKPTPLSVVTHATVAIDALAPHPANYRKHPDTQVDRLAASLSRFGQVRSIVVQSGAPGRYLIVAGHGVVQAAQKLGMTELHADVIPADWQPEQISGYLVADNMGGADDDLVVLAQLLEEQKHAGYPLESLGYDDAALDALLAELADQQLAEDDTPPEFKEYDESVEDDLPTEMCEQCGKLCLKPGAKVKN